jgi:hypothetical protein
MEAIQNAATEKARARYKAEGWKPPVLGKADDAAAEAAKAAVDAAADAAKAAAGPAT